MSHRLIAFILSLYIAMLFCGAASQPLPQPPATYQFGVTGMWDAFINDISQTEMDSSITQDIAACLHLPTSCDILHTQYEPLGNILLLLVTIANVDVDMVVATLPTCTTLVELTRLYQQHQTNITIGVCSDVLVLGERGEASLPHSASPPPVPQLPPPVQTRQPQPAQRLLQFVVSGLYWNSFIRSIPFEAVKDAIVDDLSDCSQIPIASIASVTYKSLPNAPLFILLAITDAARANTVIAQLVKQLPSCSTLQHLSIMYQAHSASVGGGDSTTVRCLAVFELDYPDVSHHTDPSVHRHSLIVRITVPLMSAGLLLGVAVGVLLMRQSNNDSATHPPYPPKLPSKAVIEIPQRSASSPIQHIVVVIVPKEVPEVVSHQS